MQKMMGCAFEKFSQMSLRTAALLCLVCLSFFAQAQVPVVGQMSSAGVLTVPAALEKINLRPYWQETTLPAAHGLSVDALMALPADQFVRNAGQMVANLGHDKELLLRTRLQFEKTDPVWTLEIPLARLDEVFVHYRFADNIWHTAHMGDRVPFKEWPFLNQHPAVQLNGIGNTVDVLLQVRHAGRFTGPVWVKSDIVFRNERLYHGLLNGLIMGFMMAMAVVCVASWRAFGNSAFNWVAVQLLMFAFAVATYQGYGDMFIWGDAYPNWRDQSKLISTMFLLAVMLPLFTTSLGMRATDNFSWGLSIFVGILVLVIGCAMSLMVPAQWRVTGAAVLSITVLSGAAWVCVTAVRRGERIGMWLSLCLGMYAFCIVATALDNLFPIEIVDITTVAPLGYAVGTLCLIYGLYRTHRFGKTVRTQDLGADRFVDALTGLPNREGFDKEFAHHILQLRALGNDAVFVLVRLAGVPELAEYIGREQFEEGVLTLGASLVSCLLPGETLARLNDTTFAIIASEHTDSASADQLASQVLARCLVAYSPGREVRSRVVILPIPSGGSLAESVLHKCESALLIAQPGKRIIKLHANGQPVHSGISLNSST